MKITDEKIKLTAAQLLKSRPRGECPDESVLGAFIEGTLSESGCDDLLRHLSRCPSCLATVNAMRDLAGRQEQETACRVPLSALDRARRLDPAAKSVLDVVVSFARGVVEVIKTSEGVISGRAYSAAAARGEPRAVSKTLVTVSREFPPYQAEVDVEKTKSDRGEVTVTLLEAGRPARGLRVTIFNQDEELESSMLDGGVAVFENLKFGAYRLDITRVGEPVGRITLELKGDGK